MLELEVGGGRRRNARMYQSTAYVGRETVLAQRHTTTTTLKATATDGSHARDPAQPPHLALAVPRRTQYQLMDALAQRRYGSLESAAAALRKCR